MSDLAPPRVSWRDWFPAIATALAVTGAMLTGGGYINQVQEQGRKIEKLEQQVAELSDFNIRLTRIETKIDMIVPARERER